MIRDHVGRDTDHVSNNQQVRIYLSIYLYCVCFYRFNYSYSLLTCCACFQSCFSTLTTSTRPLSTCRHDVFPSKCNRNTTAAATSFPPSTTRMKSDNGGNVNCDTQTTAQQHNLDRQWDRGSASNTPSSIWMYEQMQRGEVHADNAERGSTCWK